MSRPTNLRWSMNDCNSLLGCCVNKTGSQRVGLVIKVSLGLAKNAETNFLLLSGRSEDLIIRR